jgi:uncharacterized protein (DUF58 family)
MSFFLPLLFPIAYALVVILLASVLAEAYMLNSGVMDVQAEREAGQVLSLSDQNPILIRLYNLSKMSVQLELIDELPVQLQERHMKRELTLELNEQRDVRYHVRPLSRGEYFFGHIQVLMRGPLGLLSRKLSRGKEDMVKVLPSIIQMKEFELKAFSRIATQDGVKKLRKIGVSYEFEQIHPYVKGDDIRHINWKASARRQDLMVNRFETERSQSVYNVICKNREMRMPFNGLSLMDHAVNTSLAVSNVALHKYDKAGLITFSDKIGSTLRASRESRQLKQVMTALYNEKERETEANYELLISSLRKIAPNRSLIFLYINFESSFALDRALPYLKSISKRHLLVVIFFRNVEIESLTNNRAKDVKEIYSRTIAQRMVNEKEAMRRKLHQAQIQTILTEPDKLSMHTVEKYLELKGRGSI